MKRRWFMIVGLLFAAMIALLVYMVERPRTIASFDSPDGRWQLVVRDVDSSSYQVTAEFSVQRHGSWSRLPGEPCQVYNDSCDPTLGRPVWTDHSVRIGGLQAEFGDGKQFWSRAPAATSPAP
jgi:hypothetical protein